MSPTKTCCKCDGEIIDEDEANFIFGYWSHKECDEKALKQQKIKYLRDPQ